LPSLGSENEEGEKGEEAQPQSSGFPVAATTILPPSTLPTPTELKRKKRSRTERGNNERQRRD
jgi:hypothetical protein